MRRTAIRLAACTLAGIAASSVAAPAASAEPVPDPGRTLPGTSSASYHAPPFTGPLGRKLG